MLQVNKNRTKRTSAILICTVTHLLSIKYDDDRLICICKNYITPYSQFNVL